jgi:hypothetical protein
MTILPGFALAVIFQSWSVVLSLVNAYTYELLLYRYRRHWLVQLADLLDLSPIDQACASFHHGGGPGKPVTHSVPRLVRAVLLKYLYCLSLRQTEEQVDCHLLCKWFVGYSLFEQVFDHTTLERFELWLLTYQRRLFFDEILRQIDQAFPQDRRSPHLVDSYAMLARAAKVSLIPLVRATCRHLLAELERGQPSHHAHILSLLDLTALFGVEDEPAAPSLTETERQGRLQSVVTEALRCHRFVREVLLIPPLLSSELRQPIQTWLDRLSKILADEVRLTSCPDQPELLSVTELPNRHKGTYRIASATDPMATYREHGKNKPAELAYNVSLLTSLHFIRDLQADTGCRPDPLALPDLLTSLVTHHGYYPPWLIGDMAYGSGKSRRQVALLSAGQTQLVAALPPYETRADRFSPYDFSLAEDGSSLTCPNGLTTFLRYRSTSGEGDEFRFPAKACQGCPFWPTDLKASSDGICRDPASRPTAHRMVFISDYRSEVEAARAFNQTAPFSQLIKRRPLIERFIFNLTHYHGGRRASRTGQLKADFQAKMAATAFNLRQWLRLRHRSLPTASFALTTVL